MSQGPADSWIDLGLVSAESGRPYKVRLLRHSLQPRAPTGSALQKAEGGRISPAPQVLAVSPRVSYKLDNGHNLWGISLEESTHGGLIKISRILDGSVASKPCGVTSDGQTTRYYVCLSVVQRSVGSTDRHDPLLRVLQLHAEESIVDLRRGMRTWADALDMMRLLCACIRISCVRI